MKPAGGVAALIVCDPYDFSRMIGQTTITLPKVVLVGVLVGLMVRRASLAPLFDPRARGIVLGALAILAATALSAIPAEYIDAVVRETLKALQNVVTLAAAAVAFAADPDEEYAWGAIAVATLSVCLLAITQEFTIAPSGVLIHGQIYPRIAGPLDGPNQLSGYFDLAIPMLVAELALRRRTQLGLALLGLAIVTDVLTLSRAGLLGAAIGSALVLALTRQFTVRRLLVVGVAAGGLFGGLLARAGALGRYASLTEIGSDNGLATRPILWGAAVKMWLRDPGLGIGAGNFELRTPSVGLIGVRTHANSLYLQSLAEGGILLLAAVVWTIVAAVATMLSAPARSMLAIGIAAATVALATHEFFDLLSFFPKVGGYWWILLGTGIGALGTGTRTEPIGQLEPADAHARLR